jgi:hypothetical protein
MRSMIGHTFQELFGTRARSDAGPVSRNDRWAWPWTRSFLTDDGDLTGHPRLGLGISVNGD